MLAKAKEEWEQEIVDKQAEKERYLAERVTPLHTNGLSLSQLQVSPRAEGGVSSLGAWRGIAHRSAVVLGPQDLCRELHEKVEIVDEERYDIEAKCNHNTREVGNRMGCSLPH